MPRLGTWLSTMIAVAVLAAVAGPALAAGDVYTVETVKVDVRAESAAKARQQALAKAHRTAFDRLMRRIVPHDRLSALPQVSQDRLNGLVSSFEINTSQTSDVRYIGELTFSFQRAAVRSFLRDNQVPFAETRSQPTVVLALFGSRSDSVLWADPNPWRQAWVRRPNDTGLVPFAVPLGDLGDIQAISAEEALTHAGEPVRAIAERYDAAKTLVTRAVIAGEPEAGTAAVRTANTLIPGDGRPESFAFTVNQREGESREALFDRAADRVARRVQDRWKRANLLQFDQRRTTSVHVPLSGLDDWVRVRRRLADVPVVARVQVERMARTGADVRLVYFGDRDQLGVALSQNGLQLTPAAETDGLSVLRPAGAVAEPAIGDGTPAAGG
ncbi:hypothetical protein SAMN05216241_102473 [Limimonas halophila]|uniref:DUF2066 domain-containing protein n=1 Tax=Limimonas halophila TaxID=1082479 RepID=A0A1G7PAS6_9PROT|nr:DUF2066 domain-containing protein [Limimonas halophila]SDF82570.1 hypothetical protein SAMN05216241_102473 [Limimonas halophila]